MNWKFNCQITIEIVNIMVNEVQFSDVLSFFLCNAFNSAGRKFQMVKNIDLFTLIKSERNGRLFV